MVNWSQLVKKNLKTDIDHLPRKKYPKKEENKRKTEVLLLQSRKNNN
jgi:hypothetical protein